MKSVYRILLFFTFLGANILASGQGSTTSGMNGKITDENGELLPGANVVAVHLPTGSQFVGTTNLKGVYNIPNMDVGGPYKVTISFIGYKTFEKNDIYLTLGQTYSLSPVMSQTSLNLSEALVVAKMSKEYNPFDGNKSGTETVIGVDHINVMPTVGRTLTDFTRLTPQASITADGAISIAGLNNRFNAISIDGAVNNDMFGLAPTGTNGGQTGGTPISMDAIEQFQVVIAPYDVRQGGFAGGSINAVTRRGTNKFQGSAYYLMRNQSLAGKTPAAIEENADDRKSLPDFNANTFGMRLGGALIENKLFFFINAELQRDETPNPFEISTYTGDSKEADLIALQNKLINDYGYDPGGYKDFTNELNSNKFFVRLDYNLNTTHRLTLRHSYVKNESITPYSASNRSINFYNNGVYFPSVTNSTALEFKSNFKTASNSLILGYTSVFDDRDPMGDNFPYIRIDDGAGTIIIGSERYSTANQLKQNVLTLTDNFQIYKGDHTITIGTNNEFGSVYNLFMRHNFGNYYYNSLSQFMNGDTASVYERGYSLVDDVTGDGSKAAAEFNMLQLGFYAQDEWQVNKNFKLTYGLRLDVPMFLSNPEEDTYFNGTTLDMLKNEGYDMEGARAGKMPKSQIMVSPRIGFNYDVTGEKETQIRGGVGIFTSRLPLVWPGGSYTNNGLTIGGLYITNPVLANGTPVTFNPNWNQQYTQADFGGSDVIPSGQMDLFAENFKFPQVFRTNLALDQKLPWGIIGTIEGIFTKTLNNVLYYNYNIENEKITLTGTGDNREIYDPNAGRVDDTYGRIMLGTNTNKGYSYNITAQLQKPFENGLTATLAYTFGRSKSINDGLSSQNSSQWRYVANVNGRNNLDLGYSSFDLGHRIIGFLSYTIDYANMASTTISLFYNGQSGDRYSYVYDGAMTSAEDYYDYDLIYVPKDQNDINLIDYVDNDGNTVTAAQQWADLEEYIKGDNYLESRKGMYAERFGARLPFEHRFDFKIAQQFYLESNNVKHRFELTFDIFNFGNFINPNWGVARYVAYDTYNLINFEGFKADGTTPEFTFKKPSGEVGSIDDSGINSSRWYAQFGVRYEF